MTILLLFMLLWPIVYCLFVLVLLLYCVAVCVCVCVAQPLCIVAWRDMQLSSMASREMTWPLAIWRPSANQWQYCVAYWYCNDNLGGIIVVAYNQYYGVLCGLTIVQSAHPADNQCIMAYCVKSGIDWYRYCGHPYHIYCVYIIYCVIFCYFIDYYYSWYYYWRGITPYNANDYIIVWYCGWPVWPIIVFRWLCAVFYYWYYSMCHYIINDNVFIDVWLILCVTINIIIVKINIGYCAYCTWLLLLLVMCSIISDVNISIVMTGNMTIVCGNIINGYY